MTRDIDDVARRRQDALGAPRHLGTDIGEHGLAPTPLHQLYAERLLQLTNLHGQGRLGHGAGLGSTAEVPVLDQGGEILKLSQGDHGDKLFLSR